MSAEEIWKNWEAFLESDPENSDSNDEKVVRTDLRTTRPGSHGTSGYSGLTGATYAS